MTDLEELAAMINRLRNGRSCWCLVAINPAIGEHTPTCRDALALLNKVGYERIDDARHGR